MTANKKLAAEQAGYSIASVHRYLKDDDFANRVREIDTSHIWALEGAALDFALHGDREIKTIKVFDKNAGKEVSKVIEQRKHSAAMMQYILSRKDPNTWDKETIKHNRSLSEDVEDLPLELICQDLGGMLKGFLEVQDDTQEE
ncbi:hypothetical protein LQM11_003081 [Vibrio parahaemolyticus]|nr:hypothetical protein [Vibrio parahaemolyticus]